MILPQLGDIEAQVKSLISTNEQVDSIFFLVTLSFLVINYTIWLTTWVYAYIMTAKTLYDFYYVVIGSTE